MMETDVDTRARIALEDFAATRLSYILDETAGEKLSNPEAKFYVGDKYKMQVTSRPLMTPQSFLLTLHAIV